MGTAALADLLPGYKTLVASGTKFENLGAVITEFNKGATFAEGECWIQCCILEHPEEFKGRTIIFESRLDAGETVRRADVVVKMEENSGPLYYEFKSVAKIPPQHFARQFLNDIEVTKDLEQIKWYFDGRKVSKLDKELFLKELKNYRMRCLVAILFILTGLKVYAQGEKSFYNFTNVGMTFLSINTDARSGGMGEIGVASLPDDYSHQQNAAKYIFMNPDRKGGVNLFYVPWLRHLVNDMHIAGLSGYYRIGRMQSVSASFRYFSLGDLRKTDVNLQPLGDHNPYELAFDAAYARQLGKYFSMSLAFRLAVSDVVQKYRKATNVAFDLGGYYCRSVYTDKTLYKLAIGYALTNVGNKINYGPDDKLFLPSELKIGIGLTGVFRKYHQLSVGLEGGKYLVSSKKEDRDHSLLENIGASFSDREINRIFWKVGFEYGFQEMVYGRVGYFNEGKAGLQRKYTTFGTGIRFMHIHLDAAYLVSHSRNNHPLDNSFRLSAGIDF